MTETPKNEFDPREHAAPVRPAVKAWRGEIDPPDGYPFMLEKSEPAPLIAPDEWEEGMPICAPGNRV